jgi:hypothetical protein
MIERRGVETILTDKMLETEMPAKGPVKLTRGPSPGRIKAFADILA